MTAQPRCNEPDRLTGLRCSLAAGHQIVGHNSTPSNAQIALAALDARVSALGIRVSGLDSYISRADILTAIRDISIDTTRAELAASPPTEEAAQPEAGDAAEDTAIDLPPGVYSSPNGAALVVGTNDAWTTCGYIDGEFTIGDVTLSGDDDVRQIITALSDSLGSAG